MKKIIWGSIIIILLTPLGLLAPDSAWGEWGLDEIGRKIGFIPTGMKHFNQVITNILPDYGISGFDKNFIQSALGYILSAFVGIAAIAFIFWLLDKFTPGKENA